ncbi:MAG: IPT/TIG domain-containing protein [Myxococcota bacterium]
MLRSRLAYPLTVPVALLLTACPPSEEKPKPPAPVLLSVSPIKGDYKGGQPIILTGENLADVVEVKFGVSKATAVQPSGDGKQLTVTSPPGQRGTATVEVSAAGGTASLPNAFTYVAQVVIEQLDPPRMSADAETTLTVRGKGFLPPLSARITGATQANATVGQGTELAVPVTIPPLAVGTYQLTITNGDNEFGTVELQVTPPIRITRLDPDAGFDDETLPVTITGSGFTGVTEVLFGTGQCAGLTIISDTKLTCTAPVGAAGVTDVIVRRSPGDEGRAAGAFTYVTASDTAVRVLYASPRKGRSTGGGFTDIAATGLNLSATRSVRFGNVDANVLDISPDGRRLRVGIPAYTPANGAVFEDVAINLTVGGQTSTKPGGFTYFVRPAIFEISPIKGATVGGDLVTITGEGFMPEGMGVQFDGLQATEVTRVVTNRITCKIPAHPIGFVDVTVSSEFDTSEPSVDAFEFVEAVRVTQLDPPTVSIAGGTIVDAIGSGFVAGRMRVTLGDEQTEIPNVTWLAPNRLRVVMPQRQQAGVVRFRVEDTQPLNPALAIGEINVEYVDHTTRYGNVGGGPISRNISVSVVRQDTGERVQGAEVFVGPSWANAPVRRTTDAKGMTVLATETLTGPVTITAAREGYENQARVRLDASEITFALLPINPAQVSGPTPAQISGYVDFQGAGYPQGAAPGQIKRLAVVYVSEPDQGLSPIHPGQFNVVSENGDCDITPDGINNPLPQQFTIDATPNTRVALMAAVYFYDSRNGACEPGSPQQPNQEGEGLVAVTASAVGLKPDVFVQAGTNPGHNILVNRTVTPGMNMTMTGAPSLGGVGSTARTIDAILDVGASGIFTFFNDIRDQASFTSQFSKPAAGFFYYSPGDFMNVVPTALPAPGNDIKYILRGISAAPVLDQGNNIVGYTQPQSEVWLRNVSTLQADINGWFQFPSGFTPGNGTVLQGRRFRWNAPSQTASFITLDIGERVDDQNIEPRWSILLPGDVTEFDIPDLTGAPSVTDLQPGQNLFQVGFYAIFDEDGFQYNDHTNDRLGEPHWRARTLSEPVSFEVQ